MNDLHWFPLLTEERKNTISVLKKTGLIEVIVSHIVDTYRESAHFIFELLQNADDVKATRARFELKKDGIWFVHNGTVAFSITDPELERNPGINPGHINSITTFSLSTKKEDIENKIGKFGIGFKSVFQYTDSPHIYSPPYNFKISDYMVPYQIDPIDSEFNDDETTMLWLPFDRKDQDVNKVYDEILQKLKDMRNPLLFLRTLEQIDIKSESGDIIFTKSTRRINADNLTETDVFEIMLNDDKILRFDKRVLVADKDNIFHNLPINLAFVVDRNNKISKEKEYKHYLQHAWCYFPTKQETKLNYIINAPFILTPNREALRENRTENDQMIAELAKLIESAADSLKSLGYMTEEFLSTIPIPSELPKQFLSIGKKLEAKILNGEFLPTKEGGFISCLNAYLCLDKILLPVLVQNDFSALRKLTGNPRAKVIISERSSVWSDSNQYTHFYKTFIAEKQELGGLWFGSKFQTNLLEGASIDFHMLFFKYLAQATFILDSKQSLIKKAFIPIFDAENRLTYVTPNNSLGEPQVLISGTNLYSRKIVADFLKNDHEICAFLEGFLGFGKPDEFDDFLFSLDRYETGNFQLEVVIGDLALIYEMFLDLSVSKKAKLIEKLKSLSFFPVKNHDNEYVLVNPFNDVVYFLDEVLIDYFSKSSNDLYWTQLLPSHIRIDAKLTFREFCAELDVELKPYKKGSQDLDGLDEYLTDISLDESFRLSRMLCERDDISFLTELDVLKTKLWLFDSNGIKKIASEIGVGQLHPNYPEEFTRIHIDLGALLVQSDERYVTLLAEERELLLAIAPALKELSPEEIKKVLAEFIAERKRSNIPPDSNNKIDLHTPQGLVDSWTKQPIKNSSNTFQKDLLSSNLIPSGPTAKEFWTDLADNNAYSENPGGFVSAPVVGMNYARDQGDKIKKQLEKALEVDLKRNSLIDLAGSFETYSFGWFKTLLELEDSFTAEDRIKKNPMKIFFNKADLDDEGILILSEAAYIPSNIEEVGPISIQLYIGDDRITIKGEIVSPQKRSIHIKLSSSELIKTLRVSNINRAVVEASSPDFILERLKNAFTKLNFHDSDNLKSPSILPDHLNFVFGPPGTGKTTYLSWLIGGKSPGPIEFCGEAVVSLMESGKNRVLVLTPTNKAADVIAEKILKNYEEANDFPSWLIRFGQSEALEKNPIFISDRKLDISYENKCTLITTIARYPYDHFDIMEKGKIISNYALKDFGWDVIIFDEASMISQASLLYVVYYALQSNPEVRFYIGGDPFQIPPIIQFEYPFWSYLPDPAFDNQNQPILDELGQQLAWKQDGGNIYSFVGLMKDNSFMAPETNPHRFRVHSLKKQFRSLVPIGSLFSNYRYGGLLEHNRTVLACANDEHLEPISILVKNLPLNILNIIRFPVNRYGGIYRSRSVNGSPYQIYSAIFTVELIRYIQANSTIDGERPYKIGIISPYAIQSGLISKLIDEVGAGKIEVVTGTVHGFQGDECNLVIVVLNPPRNITRSPRSFLNKKNILNVAISRAKDKIIILTPYDPDNELNLDDLHQLRWIEHLAGSLIDCRGHVTGYEATDIEKSLWGSSSYIEDVTISTSHQKINIYAKAVRRFEIRHDENAVDVLINKME